MSARVLYFLAYVSVAALATYAPDSWQPRAAAQDKPHKGTKRSAKRKAKTERPPREPAGRTQHAHAPNTPAPVAPAARVDKEQAPASAHAAHSGSAAAAAAALDPGASVRTEGGTEVKAMEFSGLDIEGSLKTPQMLYFLKRLRAEFDHPRLPHRSFMPELARSTKERDF